MDFLALLMVTEAANMDAVSAHGLSERGSVIPGAVGSL